MPLREPAWGDSPRVETETFRRTHLSGETIEIPVACITGSTPGPTFGVMSGMHAGEYAGILAAQHLIREVKPEQLSGRLIVVPVISTRAFMMRYMQLSPVDDKEAHFCTPGNPEGSYTDLLIDSLFSIVKGADFLIDLHAGEFAQALLPWVPVPMVGPAELQEASRRLALGFRSPTSNSGGTQHRFHLFASHLPMQGLPTYGSNVGRMAYRRLTTSENDSARGAPRRGIRSLRSKVSPGARK